MSESMATIRQMTKLSYNFFFCFGFPILISSIKPEAYNKKNIIDTITRNYNKQPIRERWAKGFGQTDIHHSYDDENNSKFEKVDYSSLNNSYAEVLQKYIKNLYPISEGNISFRIVNYTASKEQTYMKPHIHSECEFSMIHYVQFDKEHKSTTFVSPYTHSDFWKNNLNHILDLQNTNNSWLHEEWQFPTEEDTVIIFPSILKHYVRNVVSERLRIAISTNISIR